MTAIEDPIERLSIRTSHPLWLVERWVKQFGFEETQIMCEINLTAPIMTGRVNTTKISPKECLIQLESEGFEVKGSSSCT